MKKCLERLLSSLLVALDQTFALLTFMLSSFEHRSQECLLFAVDFQDLNLFRIQQRLHRMVIGRQRRVVHVLRVVTHQERGEAIDGIE